MLFVFVCVPVHLHGHSDRCWSARVMDFNVYWVALPTGGRHTLLVGCSCKVREAWNRRQCTLREAQNYDNGMGGRTVKGVHESVTRDTEQKCNWGHGKRVSIEV